MKEIWVYLICIFSLVVVFIVPFVLPIRTRRSRKEQKPPNLHRDDISSEVKPEIDPEVESLVSGCEYRTNSSSDPTWRCQAKDEGEDGKLPACLVVTRDDLDECKDYYTFAEICDQPEQSGE